MKTILKVFKIFGIICGIFSVLIYLIFDVREHKIETEYGDSFSVFVSFLEEESFLKDNHSDFALSVYYDSKRDLVPVCDSAYFRCYRYQNDRENLFICKIKKIDEFFSVTLTNQEYAQYIVALHSEEIMSEFLCDSHLMEICLPYLDELYHDELLDISRKLAGNNFEGLQNYGLTNDMINDKENFNQKIAVMTDYLQKAAAV